MMALLVSLCIILCSWLTFAANELDGGLAIGCMGRWETRMMDVFDDKHPLYVVMDADTVIVATRSEIAIAAAGLGSHANWTRIYSPSAMINCLKVFDSVIYIGADDGLYVSHDRETWLRMWTYPTSDIYARGIDIYAGTAHGLLISHDGGGSWTTFLEGNISPLFVIDHEAPRIIVATINASSIAQSRDDGETWTFYRVCASMSAIIDIAVIRESIFVTTSRGLFIGQSRDPDEPAWTRAFSDIALRTIVCTLRGSVVITSATGLREWNGTVWRTYTVADGLGGNDVCDFAEDANATTVVAIYAFAPIQSSASARSSSSSSSSRLARGANWTMIGAGMGIICVGLASVIAGIFGCIRPCISRVRRDEFEGRITCSDDRSMSLLIHPRFAYTFRPCRIRAFTVIVVGSGVSCGGAALVVIGSWTKYD